MEEQEDPMKKFIENVNKYVLPEVQSEGIHKQLYEVLKDKLRELREREVGVGEGAEEGDVEEGEEGAAGEEGAGEEGAAGEGAPGSMEVENPVEVDYSVYNYLNLIDELANLKEADAYAILAELNKIYEKHFTELSNASAAAASGSESAASGSESGSESGSAVPGSDAPVQKSGYEVMKTDGGGTKCNHPKKRRYTRKKKEKEKEKERK